MSEPLHFARTVEPFVPASMSVEQLAATVACAGAAPTIPAAIAADTFGVGVRIAVRPAQVPPGGSLAKGSTRWFRTYAKLDATADQP